METYTWLRAFADSWHLLFMFVFFIAVVIFAFRPGSRKVHDETSNMIFRNDERPAVDSDEEPDDAQGAKESEAR